MLPAHTRLQNDRHLLCVTVCSLTYLLSYLLICGDVLVVCSNVKTIKGDLIPYLVRQQFTDNKTSVEPDDTNWGSVIFLLCLTVIASYF